MFTDSHSHIHFIREFPDVENVITRAEANGVTRQILVGCGPRDCFQLPGFLKKYEDKDFWGTLGIHPHEANKVNDQLTEDFARLIGNEKKIVAIGEIGLDYFRNLQPQDVQKKAFIMQLDLALQLDLPVVVHVRDAWEDAIEILVNSGIKRVILHTYSGGMDLAKKCWDRGFYTSFSGVVTYPKNEELRDIAAVVPDDLFLIETDCPYLSPQKYRGQRNEPAYVVETAKEIARVRRMAFEEIAELTTKNTEKAFGLRVT